MAVRAISVALLLSLVIAGCGTVANLAEQHPGAGGVVPFGGVRRDMACLDQAASVDGGFIMHADSASTHTLLCAVDLPFSFIGDVLTWPYAVSYTCINQPVPPPPVTVVPTVPPPPAMADSPAQPPPLEVLPEPKKAP
jgi:uncharacterized protein YceK